MLKQMRVIYHHHSGFSVQMNQNLFIFDYWLGETNEKGDKEVPAEYRLSPYYLCLFDHVYVFVSHSHPDHYYPEIFKWKNFTHVEYIFGDDVEPPAGLEHQHIMKPGDTLEFSEDRQEKDVTVTAYPSTDLGVSFYVLTGDVAIFHAGDLNFWHWSDECNADYVHAAEEDFNEALESIGNLRMDLCMFPLDPRMGKMFSIGAERFIMRKRPAIFIPMHYFQHKYAPSYLANQLASVAPYTRVMPINEDGREFVLQIVIPENDGPRHYRIGPVVPVQFSAHGDSREQN